MPGAKLSSDSRHSAMASVTASFAQLVLVTDPDAGRGVRSRGGLRGGTTGWVPWSTSFLVLALIATAITTTYVIAGPGSTEMDPNGT